MTLTDILIILGGALLVGGIAAYDWRLAMIVCGALLLCGGIAGLVRGK